MFYRFLCARLLWGGVLCRRNGLPLRPYPFLVRCILLVSRCEYSCSFPSPRYDAGGDLLAINMVPGAHVRPSWVRSLGRASGPALPVPKGWGKRASLVTLSPRAKAFPPLRFRTLSVIFHGLDHCSRCIGAAFGGPKKPEKRPKKVASYRPAACWAKTPVTASSPPQLLVRPRGRSQADGAVGSVCLTSRCGTRPCGHAGGRARGAIPDGWVEAAAV